MSRPQILEDDSLLVVMLLPRTLALHKIVQKVSFFYYGFFIITFFGGILYIFTSNEWHFLIKQYSAIISGMSLALASYITMYHTAYIKMFWNIHYDIFPSLWPLRSLGKEEFDKFQKIAKVVKIILVAMLSLSVVSATGALPWEGNLYDMFIVVKIATDHIEGWLLTVFLIIYYSSFYHIGFTIVATVCCLTYLVAHMYNQFRMLYERLRNLSRGPVLNPLEDTAYQDFVSAELISCIKLHQTLLKYSERLNQLIYYPIFYFTSTGILIGLSLILFPKTSIEDFVRVVSVAVVTVCVTVAFCIMGQIVEDESEEVFVSAYNTSWYLWNISNRKLLCLFLLKSTKKVVLSSSGIITINYQLLIKLYRAIYSVLTFLLNVSKSF